MSLSSEIPELPMDLMMDEIFTKLSIKSLMKIKCVSKFWLSLICSKSFTRRFFKVASPRLYLCLSDLSDNRNSVILSSAPPITSTPHFTSFVVDHAQTIPRKGVIIRQNLHGFMCYEYMECPRIYNPTTRQLVTLPNITPKNMIIPPRAEKHYDYFFGYDPINDQYVVLSLIQVFIRIPLQLISAELWVFVLKAGGSSWKRVALTPPDFCPHVTSNGVCIDGVIYYLAWASPYKSLVVSYNIRSEELNMIPVPHRDGSEKADTIKYVTLVDYGGKPALFYHAKLRDKGVVALWTVENAESKEWSCKSLVVQPCQLHLVNSFTFRVAAGSDQSGKVLLIPEDMIYPFNIISYDLQTNDMKKIEIKEIPNKWFSMGKDKVFLDVMFMDKSESLIYLET